MLYVTMDPVWRSLPDDLVSKVLCKVHVVDDDFKRELKFVHRIFTVARGMNFPTRRWISYYGTCHEELCEQILDLLLEY